MLDHPDEIGGQRQTNDSNPFRIFARVEKFRDTEDGGRDGQRDAELGRRFDRLADDRIFYGQVVAKETSPDLKIRKKL